MRRPDQTPRFRSLFPAAHERLQQAAAAMPPGTPAQPFIDALTELVQAQAETPGFVSCTGGRRSWNGTFRPDCPARTT